MNRDDLKVAVMAAIPMIAVIALLWSGAVRGEDAGSGPAATEGVIFVNDEPITRAEFEAAMNSLPEEMRMAVMSEGGRRELAEQLVRQKLFVQEARRRGVDEDPAVEGAVALAENNILAMRGLEAVAGDIDREDLRSIWPTVETEFEEATAEQIVIGFDGSFLGQGTRRSEEDARELAEQVGQRAREGEDFQALREEFSDDKGSDGMLPVVTRSTTSGAVADALFNLEQGEVSEPVKTDFGWHVFRMISRRSPTFEETRRTLQQDPGTPYAQAILRRLRSEADVRFDEDFFRNPFQR